MNSLKRTRAAAAVLGVIPVLFLAAGARAGAQQVGDKAKAVDAVTAKSPAELPIEIPLAGLSSTNSPQVVQAVAAIEHSVFECTGCTKIRAEKGQCCGKDTVAKTQKVAADGVQAGTSTKGLNVTIRAGHTLRLSEIDAALKEKGVHVDRDQLSLPAQFELTIVGLPSKASATELEKALKDGGLVEPLASDFDEGAKRLALRAKAKASAAPFRQIAEQVQKASAAARVEDVTWAGACTACQAKGMKQASCRECWPHDGSA